MEGIDIIDFDRLKSNKELVKEDLRRLRSDPPSSTRDEEEDLTVAAVALCVFGGLS